VMVMMAVMTMTVMTTVMCMTHAATVMTAAHAAAHMTAAAAATSRSVVERDYRSSSDRDCGNGCEEEFLEHWPVSRRVDC
jgi:hypothetical protein